eukprot:TRINITY_DN17129_c0_g1_i3.p1 TRINITY_DN17129_c0_g1~~TRINITY_DN17129_c0_g1_i3.p1  ORF type:complete len:368 (+),score=82.61 TRINITY_DN17129_c0_g1_i3:103-1206(+)
MSSAEFCRDIVALVTEELGAPDYEVVTLRNSTDGASAMKMKVSQLKSEKAAIDTQLHKLEKEIEDYEQQSRETDLSNMSGAMEVLKCQFKKAMAREAALQKDVDDLKAQLQERDSTIRSMSIQIQKQREEIFAANQNRGRYGLANQRSSSAENVTKLCKKTSSLASKQNSYTRPGTTKILRFGIEVTQDIGGALITSVDGNGLGSSAGLLASDVIFDFDNKAITSPDELQKAAKVTRSRKIHVGVIRRHKVTSHRNMIWKVIDLSTPIKQVEEESSDPTGCQNAKFVRTDANTSQSRSDLNVIHSNNTPPSSPESTPVAKATPKCRPTIPKLHLPLHSNYGHTSSHYHNGQSHGSKHVAKRNSKTRK